MFTFNLNILYRIDKRKTSQEIKRGIRNLTGNPAVADYFRNLATEKANEEKKFRGYEIFGLIS